MSTEPLRETRPSNDYPDTRDYTEKSQESHPRPRQSAREKSHDILDRHSRSFSLAARFLPPDRRDDAAVVYAFCRMVDDAVDEADTEADGDASLSQLQRELERQHPPRRIVRAFLDVADRRNIDLNSARELIAGCASDLDGVRIESDRELLRYCYRVAGTVGLMMSGVLGVSEPEARHHAIDLGVGMQITNICRDVLEDGERGRVYLPADRLAQAGIDQSELVTAISNDAIDDSEVREAVASVVDDLLDIADDYYSSAEHGMPYIPLRSRPAILVASRVYRGIGQKLRADDCDALAGRAIVSKPKKLYLAFTGLLAMLSTFRSTSQRPMLSHDSALHDPLKGLPGANGR